MSPLIIITCGPASEPIDQVRRITNFSTGELGARLAGELIHAGHRVVCCKGLGATWPGPLDGDIRPFTTNDDLLDLLRAIDEPVAAVFHAAALADFRVADITDGQGEPLPEGKIPSSVDEILLRLTPAAKVLPQLRAIFPTARITGWKYELEGTPEEAVELGRRQIRENHIDACVVNGAAYGEGFGLLADGELRHFADKAALSEWLAREKSFAHAD